MNLWLDDERPMPEGYDTHVRTAPEAIALLASGAVNKISLDHDLGDDPEAGNGYDVARYIEEQAFKGTLKKLYLRVHTQNPIGRKNICQALQNAVRYWERWGEANNRYRIEEREDANSRTSSREIGL